jgi:hypothetical protein
LVCIAVVACFLVLALITCDVPPALAATLA